MDVETPAHRTDWTEFESPSTAVVVTVAETLDVEEDQLPVLNEYVDGDALDTLLRQPDSKVDLSFTYDAVEVRVSSDGRLAVESRQ
ncbi:hypothetical protein GRX01_03150 [Halobaculum sp. WSA2]|uniref:Halobacterial output domain-containing protein n=1 Tax=Halobaculum saliterrae TaxID=2073113 RepID=A0A6B0SUS0_9EURY|nr:HalOD1 output domain-containing protein [Halobaculum saliterrae]MXR40353.1 hypothetical protein [Halobaculum saliterrae]